MACAVNAADDEQAFFLAGTHETYLGVGDGEGYEIWWFVDWKGDGEVNSLRCEALTTSHTECTAITCVDCEVETQGAWDLLCESP